MNDVIIRNQHWRAQFKDWADQFMDTIPINEDWYCDRCRTVHFPDEECPHKEQK